METDVVWTLLLILFESDCCLDIETNMDMETNTEMEIIVWA